MAPVESRPDSFPAPSKHASGTVSGTPTDVSCTTFSDKIMITISQGGRLGQWIQVPLCPPSPASADTALPAAVSTLPASHLTPTALLGGGGGGTERDTLGRLYAAQLASHLALRHPDDRRTLMLGLGLEKAAAGREAYFDVLDLVQKVL
ncbi:hypothetical protein P8C59_004009 [Phyllachora maydis]|uniref:Proteasome assembly chaperone 3 n=1 Tax=Phyllachora maydis TaxID=1825666 RepID=A0AAD9I1E2_9PEZI|nr:hypothetical protein P8C59_004009 [Phyllachora maydis]